MTLSWSWNLVMDRACAGWRLSLRVMYCPVMVRTFWAIDCIACCAVGVVLILRGAYAGAVAVVTGDEPDCIEIESRSAPVSYSVAPGFVVSPSRSGEERSIPSEDPRISQSTTA